MCSLYNIHFLMEISVNAHNIRFMKGPDLGNQGYWKEQKNLWVSR